MLYRLPVIEKYYLITTTSSHHADGTTQISSATSKWVRTAGCGTGEIIHEIGHAVGYQEHQPCEIDGGLAPIMMQQTFGTANNEIARPASRSADHEQVRTRALKSHPRPTGPTETSTKTLAHPTRG